MSNYENECDMWDAIVEQEKAAVRIEYGTDRWSEQEYDIERDHESYQDEEIDMYNPDKNQPDYNYEKPLEVCDWCGEEVTRTYPVYFNATDPTHTEDNWCRSCINRDVRPSQDEVPF